MDSGRFSLSRRIAAEGISTAFLLAAVVGSGIMGERLSGGDMAITLIANSLATGAALVAIILTFGPVSGAQMNPVVTVADAWQGNLPWKEAGYYILFQTIGAVCGVACANLMFNEPLFAFSRNERSGTSLIFSEFIATFGLLAAVFSCARWKPSAIPFAVGAYITAAYWFTSSTSFANPSVTLARTLTGTFTGIAPSSAPGFIAAQFAAAAAAIAAFRWLLKGGRNA